MELKFLSLDSICKFFIKKKEEESMYLNIGTNVLYL